jgi:pyridoxine/pyridoxamine 5'-phosphate oxidase
MTDTLDAVLDHAWARLLAGARGRSDPFHQGVLANVADGPEARYAVLRAVDPEAATVAFHTDRRSPKFAQLQRDPRMAWCFFGHGEQVRLGGEVTLHADDGDADAAWAAVGRLSRRTYSGPLAPGSPIDEPLTASAGLAAAPGDAAEARSHFVLARVGVLRLDWLSLAASGHRRAAFVRNGAGWDARWLAP